MTCRIDPSRIPPAVERRIARLTLRAMYRTRCENPELWARIERRAAELRREREREDEQT
jgi:hypothetical protein